MQTQATLGSYTLSHYLRQFIDFAGSRLLIALLLLLFTAITDGIGLLMLVPFLHLLGFGDTTSTSQTITPLSEQIFSSLGIPLSLSSILILYISLISIRAIALYFRETILSELRLRFVDHLRIKLYQSIAHANWRFLSSQKNADLTTALTADISRIAMGTNFSLELLISLVMVTAYITVAIQLSISMTLAALVAGVILMFLLWPQIHKSRKLGQTLTKANNAVYSTVSDFLHGIKLAKTNTAEFQSIQTFSSALDHLRQQLMGFTHSSSISNAIYQIGAAITLSGLLYLAAEVLKIPGAELLVLVLIFARLLPLLSKLQRNYQQIVNMLPAYDSAMHILHEAQKAKETLTSNINWQPKIQQTISLENISYQYNADSECAALKQINYPIRAKQTIGITGFSGSGKTTLADLLAGLIIPTSGQIKIDQHILSPQDLYTWRKSVAYVPQETFLFHDSIRNNLLWAQAGATEKQIDDALTLASAKDFIDALPQGIDTIIGERGIRLSGGERQRVALARALLAKPELLILDEATSALDRDNEKRIQKAIDNLHGELTIIIIAHRLSTLQHADNILVLDSGQLAEDGNWKELMQKPNGKLKQLATKHSNQQIL